MSNTRKTALVVSLLMALVVPMTGARADSTQTHPVQLEVGDSWTYGDGASDPARTGYAGRVYESNLTELDCVPASSDAARDGCKHLQRAIFARPGTAEHPGVTTDLLIAEQLDEATALLESRNGDAVPENDVEVILLTVGGNDTSGPVLAACLGGLTQGCVDVIRERLDHVAVNLDHIVAELRATAGDGTRIVVPTYDNAIAYCPLSGVPGATELGELVLEGHPGLGIVGLNNVIRSTAQAYGAEVAETFGRLGAGQWVGDCLHPNDAGYEKIAAIVEQLISG